MKANWFKHLIGAMALVGAGLAGAQPFPSKPIRLVVPIPPGGAPDIAARVVGQYLGEALKQPVVVENKPGSNGNIAADLVAKAPADGHTLLLSMDSAIVINPHLFARMPFNPQTDLVPVSSIGSNKFVLTVNPQLPVKNLQEFVEYARKANPPIHYASGGNGSQHHLMMEMLKQRAGIRMDHVPYKGGSPATLATVSGETSVMFAGSSNAGQIKTGKLRPIAVTSSKRADDYPELPAIAEMFPGFEAKIWLALFAPAGTPQPVIDRLREETHKVLQLPAVKERFNTAGGLDTWIATPRELDEVIKSDLAKYGKAVKEIGLKID
ncbi:tripartite tricarboxylate transporter substrate binding protein [Ramlibacter sp. AW1]|uniref:Tripartite tricarboxylate transporter substrate binding protein n=1 Tax=Ramlibacter aurantiacus TaxID=2801330 RepID=A0A936ZWR6_9BURK|nr:tripartite tricarboxylate transporter substrate binding protein [Ramlibacter aurantiacus]MBL0421949.1 tripartite tricarboxylate transporter substrate binding protein [Ramlibacter aurantiacus]